MNNLTKQELFSLAIYMAIVIGKDPHNLDGYDQIAVQEANKLLLRLGSSVTPPTEPPVESPAPPSPPEPPVPPPTPPVFEPTPPPTLEGEPTFTAGQDSFYGIECFKAGTVTVKDLERFSELGVHWVRLWHDVFADFRPQMFNARTEAIRAKRSGFKVIAVLNLGNAEIVNLTPAIVNTFFQTIKDYWKDAQGNYFIDAIEVGNEVHYFKYWKGNFQQYVDLILQPAWNILSDTGIKILGGSLDAWNGSSFSLSRLGQMLATGFKNYCHGIAFHPYRQSPTEGAGTVAEAAQIYGVNATSTHKLWLTEWAFLGLKGKSTTSQSDASGWDALYNSTYPLHLDGIVECAIYYRSTRISGEGGWPGLMLADANRTPQPFVYEQYVQWPKFGEAPEVQIIELEPTEDAYVFKQNPTTNYGSSSQLQVNGGFNEKIAYLKFDLANIGSVLEANLVLRGGSTGTASPLVSLRPTANDWQETTVTWDTRPANTGGILSSQTVAPGSSNYVFNCTSAVKTAVGGFLTLSLTQTATTQVIFDSRESATKPKLIIKVIV